MTVSAAARPAWRRWLRRLSLALVLLVLLGRLALWLALPGLVTSSMEDLGWRCAWDGLELSLLSGDLQLDRLELAPLHTASPRLSLEYARIDLGVLDLLRGELVLHRAEVDGLDLFLERDEQGALVLPPGLLAEVSGSGPDAAGSSGNGSENPGQDRRTGTPGDGPGDATGDARGDAQPAGSAGDEAGLSLRSPIRIDAARLQSVQLTWVDRSQDPPLRTRVDLDLRVSDVGSPEREARVELRLAAAGLLDQLALEVSGTVRDELLKAGLSLHLAGLQCRPLASWLEPLGLVPEGPELDADLSGVLQLHGGDTPRLVATLGGLSLHAGDRQALDLDALSVQGELTPEGLIDLTQVELLGLQGTARLASDGSLHVAGLALVPVPADSAATESDDAGGSLALALRHVRLADQRFTLWDDGVDPPSPLVLELAELQLNDLLLGGAGPAQPARLSGRLSAPGMFKELSLQGELHPGGDGGPFQLQLALSGLEPSALRQRLERAGVTCGLHAAALSLGVAGQWSRDARGDLLADVTLSDLALAQPSVGPAGAAGAGVAPGAASGGAEDVEAETLAGLKSLAFSDLRLAADSSSLHLGEVALSGLSLHAGQDADGTLHLPGFVLRAAPAPETARTESAEPAPMSTTVDAAPESALTTSASGKASAARGAGSAATDVEGMLLRVDRIELADNALSWSTPGGETLVFDDLDLSLDGVQIPARGWPSVDQLKLALSVPDRVGRLSIDGRVEPSEGRLHSRLSLVAQGLRADGLVLWSGGGALPELEQGRLGLELDLSLADRTEGLLADLALKQFSLSQAGEELLGLDALAVSGLDLGQASPVIDEVALDRLRVAVRRDAGGDWHLPGLRLPAGQGGAPAAARRSTPNGMSKVAAPLATPGGLPEAAALTSARGAGALPAQAGADGSSQAGLRLGRLVLRETRLRLRDELAHQPSGESVDETLQLDLSLSDLDLSPGAGPAALDLSLSRPRTTTHLGLAGSLLPSPSAPSATLELTGEGLDLSPVAAYLPPGVTPALSDGRLSARVELSARPAPAGGQSLAAWVSDFDLRNAGDEQVLLGWRRLGLSGPRLDAKAGVFQLDELAWDGLVLQVEQDAEGRTHLAGLAFALPTPPAAGPAGAEDRERPGKQAGEDLASDKGTPVPLRRVPELSLKRLSLDVQRVAWVGPDHEPLVLQDLTLANRGEIRLSDDDQGPAAFELDLAGRVDPLLDSMKLTARLAPFAVEPRAELQLDLTGLRGTALHDVLPGLDQRLDASRLGDGRLELALSASWLGRRRGPLDFDTRAGVPLELRLSDLSFRDGEEGEMLLGLSNLRLDVERALGADGRLDLRSLELVDPVARVSRGPGGLELLHVVLREAPAPGEPGATDAAAGDGAVAATQGAASGGVPASGGEHAWGGEQSIGRLLISGADVLYTDFTTEPVFELPLVGLDVEARDLTTRALTEKLPLTFELYLRGGAAAAREVPVFDELALTGVLSLAPRPDGRVRLDISALDLPSFAGPAAKSEVTISDGLLDGRVDLRFQHGGDLDLDADLAFTDLDVSEPAGGPISSFLKLPSPLGSVLFVLRDQDGVIDLPLSFSVAADGVSVPQITRVAVTTLGVLITTAIANTPFRVVGGLTDTVGSLIGLGGEEGPRDLGEAVSLEFLPGSARLPPDQQAVLAALAERLADEDDLRLTLRHTLGADDVALLALRANPPAEQVIDLSTGMRIRKGSLGLERDELAARLAAALSAGLSDQVAPLTERLAALDSEIGRLERALDALLDVLRPGSEGMADRRTRAMGVIIAQQRLDALARVLRAELDEDQAERVRVVSPRPDLHPEQARGSVLAEPGRVRGK